MWKKMGPKILNFQSFALYKGKIIPQCSLELDDSKNIYFSRFIFSIFRRNTLTFPIFCEIYKIPFLVIKMKSGGKCPSTIVVSVVIIDISYLTASFEQTCRLNNSFQQSL